MQFSFHCANSGLKNEFKDNFRVKTEKINTIGVGAKNDDMPLRDLDRLNLKYAYL